MGIAFIHGENVRKHARKMRIVMEKSHPLSDSIRRLSVYADNDSFPIDNEDYLKLNSILPEVGVDGELYLRFGNIDVIPSIKNFIINSHSTSIFSLYKISEDVFSLNFVAPFSPLTAFSVAIAAFCSKK
jgi:hypothetical protein